MNYYIINANVDQIGFYPQDTGGDYDVVHAKDPSSFRQMTLISRIEPKIGLIKIAHRAKLTDVLWIAGFNTMFTIVVNDKFYDSISGLIVDNHSLYDIQVVKRKKIIDDYMLLKINRAASECIDFDKSSFYKLDLKSNDRTTVQYAESDWHKLFEYRSLGTPPYEYSHKCNKLVMKTDCSKDLFSLNSLTPLLFASERLVEIVDQNGLTGISFEPIEETKWLT